jgi:hypothetical protein
VDHLKAVTLERANQAVKVRFSVEDLLLTVVGTESVVGDASRAAVPRLTSSDIVPYDRE